MTVKVQYKFTEKAEYDGIGVEGKSIADTTTETLLQYYIVHGYVLASEIKVPAASKPQTGAMDSPEKVKS